VKRLLALVSLLAAACSSGTTFIAADFRGPSAVAAFWGAGGSTDELVPWIAVASSRGNELKIVNPATDLPQRSANLSFPLSVGTLERPIHLAAGSLHDGRADALVVASSGTVIQLVGTWYAPVGNTPLLGVAVQWDLVNLVDPGSAVLGLVVVPVPTGTATGNPPVYGVVEGKAWVIAAMSGGSSSTGGKLVVLEIERGDDGEAIVLSGVPVVKPLGFNVAAMTASPDNFHVYSATTDPISTADGKTVLGVAEIDVSGGLLAPWPVRGLDGHAPTNLVAAAFVGERKVASWWDFEAPALRVYAALDSSGCGPTQRISCGIATFDPSLGGLATDPAPEGGSVPKQGYRAPMLPTTVPLALAVAIPAANPGTIAPGLSQGSQVCYSPATPGIALPPCPAVASSTAVVQFNGNGFAQRFMEIYSGIPWWSSAAGQVASGDGNTFLLDMGRFGAPSLNSKLQKQILGATPAVPAGPTDGTADLGFPSGTSAVGLVNAAGSVDSEPLSLAQDIVTWPGFTRSEVWTVVYQGLLPGLALHRGVVGLGADGATLYVALQEAYAPPPAGVLDANSPWVPLAAVASPDLAIHTVDAYGLPGDIAQFALDVDPCTPTRPNWVPAAGGAPVYDPTKTPQPHEAPIQSFLAADPILYPVGALSLAVPVDPTLADEYACLVHALRAQPGSVLSAFRTIPTSTTDSVKGVWVRTGGFVLAGTESGYAGRPQLGVRYEFAWGNEDQLSGESLMIARKARRFWYPAYYEPCAVVGCYSGYPELRDPMEPGPAVAFMLGRYCKAKVTPGDCDPAVSPPARGAGVDFTTLSTFVLDARRPTNASVGTSVTTFDRSLIPGLEYKGRVFYTTFAGSALYDVPPGLPAAQSFTIR